MNFTEYNQLEAYYTNKLLGITKKLGKRATVWQDVYDNGVRVRISKFRLVFLLMSFYVNLLLFLLA